MKLYFIAILPPKELSEEIDCFKLIVSKYHPDNRARRSPPHVTIKPPFNMEQSREDQLKLYLDSLSSQTHSFKVFLDGFGRFRQDVIFVKPLPNEYIIQLYDKLQVGLDKNGFSAKNSAYPKYVPHITIGYKRFKKQAFITSWDKFYNREFKAAFYARDLTLLRYDSGKWEVIHTAVFKAV